MIFIVMQYHTAIVMFYQKPQCTYLNIIILFLSTATLPNEVLIKSCLLLLYKAYDFYTLISDFPSLILQPILQIFSRLFSSTFIMLLYCSNCPSLFILYRYFSYSLLTILYFSAAKLPPGKLILMCCLFCYAYSLHLKCLHHFDFQDRSNIYQF